MSAPVLNGKWECYGTNLELQNGEYDFNIYGKSYKGKFILRENAAEKTWNITLYGYSNIIYIWYVPGTDEIMVKMGNTPDALSRVK
jgi:hypothetical protein